MAKLVLSWSRGHPEAARLGRFAALFVLPAPQVAVAYGADWDRTGGQQYVACNETVESNMAAENTVNTPRPLIKNTAAVLQKEKQWTDLADLTALADLARCAAARS